MSFREHAFTFACGDEELVGIIASPERPRDVGVLILVGGPQYRIGSHRQFLLLARRLAAAGYAVMRFDYRGMGDSSGEQRNFAATADDIAAAITAFKTHQPHLASLVLWGLCDAASASLLYCRAAGDSRVSGLALLNPWVRSEATLARTQIKYYYSRRLMEPEFWRKLLTGKVQVAQAIGGYAQRLFQARQAGGSDAVASDPPFPKKMAHSLSRFAGPVLLILSGNDYTAKEFLETAGTDSAWSEALAQADISRHEIAGADHTFSTAAWRQEVEDLTLRWLETKVCR